MSNLARTSSLLVAFVASAPKPSRVLALIVISFGFLNPHCEESLMRKEYSLADKVHAIISICQSSVTKQLESLISTKHVHSCCTVANQREFGCIKCARFLASMLKPCCCQFVCASAHHLPSISKKSFYCIGVHCSGVDTLSLHYSRSDLMQNQVSTTK